MDKFLQVVQRDNVALQNKAVMAYFKLGWKLCGSPFMGPVGPAQVMVMGPEPTVPADGDYLIISETNNLSLSSQCDSFMRAGWEPYGNTFTINGNLSHALLMGNAPIHGKEPNGSVVESKNGFFNYQNTGPVQTLVASTWATFQNNGLGVLTETGFAPEGVPSMLDPATGRYKLDNLKVGDQVTMRHILSSMGYVNNASVTFRNYFGQAGQQYAIPFGSTVVMNTGAGVVVGPYAVETKFYIRDENTRLGGVLPQIMSPGKVDVTFSETYISIERG